jgi:hypothetical protein
MSGGRGGGSRSGGGGAEGECSGDLRFLEEWVGWAAFEEGVREREREDDAKEGGGKGQRARGRGKRSFNTGSWTGGEQEEGGGGQRAHAWGGAGGSKSGVGIYNIDNRLGGFGGCVRVPSY